MKKRGELKHLLEASSTLMGCIIGAGILGIPYVIAQAGFLLGVLEIIILGLAIIILNLYVGEIVLRTKGDHQFTGYAHKYLGNWGKGLMIFSMTFGFYGALIAYTIGEGEIFSAILGGNPLLYSLIFFAIMSFLLYKGIKTIAESELLMVGVKLAIFLIVALMIFFSIKFKPAHLLDFNLTKIFLPYGVILFAYAGAVAIPEMKEILVINKKRLKKAIIVGTMIPLVIYALFALLVIGVTGINTTEIVTLGLGQIYGKFMVILINLFAVIAMATSFLAIGLALKEMYWYDLRFKHIASWFLTLSIPLLLFLVAIKSFIKTLAITGAIMGGVEGILIILMYFKAKKLGDKKPEYSIKKSYILASLLFLMFSLGIVYTIWHLF